MIGTNLDEIKQTNLWINKAGWIAFFFGVLLAIYFLITNPGELGTEGWPRVTGYLAVPLIMGLVARAGLYGLITLCMRMSGSPYLKYMEADHSGETKVPSPYNEFKFSYNYKNLLERAKKGEKISMETLSMVDENLETLTLQRTAIPVGRIEPTENPANLFESMAMRLPKLSEDEYWKLLECKVFVFHEFFIHESKMVIPDLKTNPILVVYSSLERLWESHINLNTPPPLAPVQIRINQVLLFGYEITEVRLNPHTKSELSFSIKPPKVYVSEN